MKPVDMKSVILGVLLCAVLVVLLGSKAAEPQVAVKGGEQARVLQRPVSTIDIYDKTVALETRLEAMDKQLNRMEQKLDELVKDMKVVIKVMWPDLKK